MKERKKSLRPRPKLSITSVVECAEWKKLLPEFRKHARKALKAVTLHEALTGPEMLEISVVWADDDFVQELNLCYRYKARPTNILSFPEYPDAHAVTAAMKHAQGELFLGDMVLALETIQREAKDQCKTLESHISHLLVHGMLHLLGYDHEKESEAQHMENKEIIILKSLAIENPYESN